jgi:peptidoglycan/LPS O-acetylase OafA/YrhL
MRLATTLGLVVADPAAAQKAPATDREQRAQPAPPRAPAERSGVRPEIQALRALAVMLVVIYHLWPSLVPGGFVGVDVFFAISGFLITAHLLREIESTGTVSMPRFWARRARRLLPASLLTLLFCVVATLVLVPTIYWQQFFREIAASTAYVENWQLSRSAVDYLQATNLPSPVQHFWSLGVEEQFYLVWPVLIVLATVGVGKAGPRAELRNVSIALLVVTIASLAFAISETAANPAAAFFVTPTRAWEFGAGGLLALLGACARFNWSSSAARSALSWVGLAAIVVAAFTYSAATPFPGYAALLPVLGAIAVIRAGAPDNAWAPTAALRLAPIQFLGNVSYSIYLWHWPLLIFTPFAVGAATDTVKVIVLVLSILAGWLTKVLVEDPARNSTLLRRRRPRLTFAFAGAATAIVLAATLAGGLHAQGLAAKAEVASARTIAAKPACFGAAAHDPGHPCANPKLRRTVAPSPLAATHDPNAPCTHKRHYGVVSTCEFGVSRAQAHTTIALIGDSHASVMRAPLDTVAKDKGWFGLSITQSGCPYSTATKSLPEPARSKCIRWNRELPGWFVKHPEVSIVFVTAITGSTVTVPEGRTMLEAKVNGYRSAWAALPDTVKHIVVIRDTPKVRSDTLQCVAQAIANRRAAGHACAVPRDKAFEVDPEVMVANSSPSDRAEAVDLTGWMCDRRICDAVIGGALVHKDVHHLTRAFATTLGPLLLRKVNRLAGLR